MERTTSTPTARGWRVNGMVFVLALVGIGLGATAVLYRWRASQLGDDFRRTRAEMPVDPSLRLERWIEYGAPLIHQRLVQLRYGPDQRWLLTHTIAVERNSPAQEVWGVDFSGLAPSVVRREGLDVVISLPRPERLGQGAIGGDMARNVPNFAPGSTVDAEARARGIVEWSIEKLVTALHRDIPQARIVVRFGEERVGDG